MGCQKCEATGSVCESDTPRADDIHGADPRAAEHERFVRESWRIYSDAHALLINKHLAYGPNNVARSPGGAANGLLVRMHDKMARLQHLTYGGGEDVVGESTLDTVRDLLNYSAILLMVYSRTWPNLGEQHA